MKKLKNPIQLTSSIKIFNKSLIATAQTIDNKNAIVIFENKKWILFNKIHISTLNLYPDISDKALRKYKNIIFKIEKGKRNMKEHIKISKINKNFSKEAYGDITKKDILKSKEAKRKRINELLLLRSKKTLDN